MGAYSFSSEKKKQRDKECKTYLLHDRGADKYKIGKTHDLNVRFRQIKTSVNDLKVIAFGYMDIESKLHKEFKHKNIFGEWFSLDEQDVINIKAQFDFTSF